MDTSSWWSSYCPCKVITESIHRQIARFWSWCISCILDPSTSFIPFRYSGHIIWIPITFSKMFILRIILTNEVMEAHGCSNNHLLLFHWETRHLENNLHFIFNTPKARSTALRILECKWLKCSCSPLGAGPFFQSGIWYLAPLNGAKYPGLFG